MISEPEMVGDFPDWPEPGTATSEDRPAAPRGRRPWLWAAGGAVAASAVWAGGLYATGTQPVVDTRGYRVGDGLCEKAELNALRLSLGKRTGDPIEAVVEHSALDRVTCDLSFVPDGKPREGEFRASYEVQIIAHLHKKADPEAEFEAFARQPRWGDGAPARLEAVDGLGEKAFLIPPPAEWEGPRLVVLDGGAVLELGITPGYESYYEGEGEGESEGEFEEPPPEPDTSALPPLMVEDLRDLMAALRS
ncbi:hypothetical protein AR457_12950 [Streptomyces agglomeratus]|uniref:hypothetical protein n=1 Tax=Streptomyces agglomeratus TaxID=285458 RepID=UPI000854DF56|nr:hypothetical protein [Streptomyces agglomeratus]OEJ40732.1 hypothetical protein BGK70_23700 [Streptomyces agglomeratus]OEJ44887.1 hypothetical protein AR457_12950 [Streptomyces agglomeratus]